MALGIQPLPAARRCAASARPASDVPIQPGRWPGSGGAMLQGGQRAGQGESWPGHRRVPDGWRQAREKASSERWPLDPPSDAERVSWVRPLRVTRERVDKRLSVRWQIPLRMPHDAPPASQWTPVVE